MGYPFILSELRLLMISKDIQGTCFILPPQTILKGYKGQPF